MNAMKLTGKAFALFFAAGIAAAALSACGDKKTDEPAQTTTQASTAAAGQPQAADADDFDMKPATEAEILEILAFLPDPVATVDGEPIPVSSQEQIFIPFFTTKKEGSGIGLSISRQIMRNHNGSIELLRSDAASTVFELRFR